MNRLLIIVTVFMLTTALFSPHADSGTVQLSRTGQTKCYNFVGATIGCPGSGQDGDILSGMAWPTLRFSDNNNGTVTDNLTGLIWLKDAGCLGPQTWQISLNSANALANGQCGLSDGSIAGQWHLPNLNELESILDASRLMPALPADYFFINIQAVAPNDSYWTSTSQKANGYINAWTASLYLGGTASLGKSRNGYALPVRTGPALTYLALPQTGQASCYSSTGGLISCTGTGQDGDLPRGVVWPAPRFTDNNDQTVTDNLTGFMWSKDAKTPGPTACTPATTKTWPNGLTYIQCLNANSYLGHNDWRLPNQNELFLVCGPYGSPICNHIIG